MIPSQQEQTVFWKTLAEGLSAGQRLIDCLKKARSALPGGEFAAVVDSIIGAVNGGKTLSEALAEHPDAFGKPIVDAMFAGEIGGVIDHAASQVAAAVQAADLGRLEATGAISPQAIEYVSQLIAKAHEARASDIHIDQLEGGQALVRQRIDGVLHRVEPPPPELLPKVIDYIKVMGAINVAERDMPQDGRCIGRDFDMRISTVPAAYGDRVFMRVISRDPASVVLGLDDLGLSRDDLRKVRELCHIPSGLVIVNGPTGTGKTTLLYSMLMELNKPEAAILTIEDPVELTFAGIGHIQIRPQIGLTFAKAIRHVMRQAPNIIMIGEIRDLEIANLCAQCSLTGLLVLTTLHADTSPGAIRRLLDMGMEPFLVASSLAGAISLRLVRKLCQCSEPGKAPPAYALPPGAAEYLARYSDANLRQPKGCDKCYGNGYLGRTAIYEVLHLGSRMRQLAADNADLPTLQAAAIEGGMRTMLMDGMEKVAQGLTTVEEVLRVLPPGLGV